MWKIQFCYSVSASEKFPAIRRRMGNSVEAVISKRQILSHRLIISFETELACEKIESLELS